MSSLAYAGSWDHNKKLLKYEIGFGEMAKDKESETKLSQVLALSK